MSVVFDYDNFLFSKSNLWGPEKKNLTNRKKKSIFFCLSLEFFLCFCVFFTGAGRFGGVAEWKRRSTVGKVKVEVVMGGRQSRPEFRVASPQATVTSGAQLWLLCGRLRVWRSCRVSEKVVASCIEAKSNRVRCRLRRCPCCKNDTRGRCGCRTVSGWV